jgi:hypothetical protein
MVSGALADTEWRGDPLLSRFPARAEYTGGHPLEKRPKTAHFFSLFRPLAAIPTCGVSIRKPFHARQIRHDLEACQRAKRNVARRPPKFSYRRSLIVQYVQPKNAVADSPAA